MKLETRARINGRDMYVIQGTPPKGPAEKLFFDMENGLLVRWDMARRLQNHQTVFVKVHLEDYRDVGGVKMPFNVRFAFESASLRIKVDEVEQNIPIDDAVFKTPRCSFAHAPIKTALISSRTVASSIVAGIW
jgi:hypothetical protein